MKNITYKHRDGREVVHSAPVPGLERSAAWSRVEGPAYGKMRKPELVELCTQRELDAEGTNPELVARLEAYDAEHRTATE